MEFSAEELSLRRKAFRRSRLFSDEKKQTAGEKTFSDYRNLLLKKFKREKGMMKNKIAAAALALAVSNAAFAGGFQLNEQSITGLGRAFAGEGIMGDDLSAAWYNPAGLTLLSGTRVQIGGVANELDVEYKGNSGAKENGRKRVEPILHQYITHQFSDRLYGGIAVVQPFGLSTSFDKDWEGNQRGYDARLMVINVSPSLAWKVNEKLSVGAGVDAQYIKAAVSMKKSVGSYGVYSKLQADDWAYGWHAGIMWSPTEKFRTGFGYRSEWKHKASGDVTMTADSATSAALKTALTQTSSQQQLAMIQSLQSMTGASMASVMAAASSMSLVLNGGAEMKSPANANWTFVYEYSPKMRLSGSVRWTNWSSLDTLKITAGTLEHKDTDVDMKWRDSWFVSLGYDLDITPKWTIRGGVAYDRSPIGKAAYRTALVPDTNRVWATLGASYRPNEHWQFDAAVTHIHGTGERDLYSSTGEKIGRFDKLNCYMAGLGVQYKF